MRRPVFTDEHEEQSYLGWFLLASIVLHGLIIWLWPQFQSSAVSGVGLDQGGIVELVFVPGQPSIQAPAPPTPTPPVQDRPARQQQAPQTQPEPQTAAVVRTEQQQVQPAAPPAPAPVVQERPAPQPEPAPTPVPQPEPQPQPQPTSAPQPPPAVEQEPGVADDILVSDQGRFEIPVTPEPEPAPEPVPEPQPVPEPEPEPAPVPEPTPEPVAAPSDGPTSGSGAPAAAAPGDEVVEGVEEGAVDGEGTEPAAPPPTSFATRFGLGSPKAVEDVPLDVVLNEVRVEIHVRPDGGVDRVVVAASSGRELVDEALVGLMERWSFEATGSSYVEVWSVTFRTGSQDGRTVWQPQPQFIERR